MATKPFDPSEAITFDLELGHVHLDGAPHRTLVPSEALLALCGAAGPEATSTFAKALGSELGRRVAVRLGREAEAEPSAAVRAAGLDAIVNGLAGELALAGLGTVGAERWGKALVLVVDQCPLGEGGDTLLAGVLEGALGGMTEAPVGVVPLHREGVRARMLVISGAVAGAVQQKLAAGESWGAVLAALHAGGAS